MKARRKLTLVTFALALTTVLPTGGLRKHLIFARGADQTSDSADLEELLAKAADYAGRLERSVFDFVCREEIKEWIDHSLEARRQVSSVNRWVRYDPHTRVIVSRLRAKPIKKSLIYDYQSNESLFK